MPRCHAEDFDSFWKEIGIRHIVYAPTISYPDLIAAYKKSKVCLFPSVEEGLGLPILEAQACGCRVATTDAEPMRSLLLDGGVALSGDDEADGAAVARMLREPFDWEALSRRAHEVFSYDDIVEKVLGTAVPQNIKQKQY